MHLKSKNRSTSDTKAAPQRHPKESVLAKRVKVYVCGTSVSELVPTNGGEVNVYMSAGACFDGERCTDECGIVECELVVGDVVFQGRKLTGAISSEEMERQEVLRQGLSDRMMKVAQNESPEAVLDAASWIVAGLRRDQRRIRWKDRLITPRLAGLK